MKKKDIERKLQVLYAKREKLEKESIDNWKLLDEKYGDDRESMRKDKKYKKLVGDAQALIDKMFTSFDKGGAWIKRQHRIGREKYAIVNVFGMVRHLWGYAHTDQGLHRSMDRKGPNSVIQGPSSNINSIAGYIFSKTAFKTKKFGKDIKTKTVNSVHDANYLMGKIENVPMAIYMAERAAVEETVAFCSKYFGWEIQTQPEVAFSMGPNLAEMHEFDFTKTSLMDAISKTIDYQKENYGYKIDKDKTMQRVSKNWDIVNEYRIKELIQQKDRIDGKTKRLLTPKVMAELPGLYWG